MTANQSMYVYVNILTANGRSSRRHQFITISIKACYEIVASYGN